MTELFWACHKGWNTLQNTPESENSFPSITWLFLQSGSEPCQSSDLHEIDLSEGIWTSGKAVGFNLGHSSMYDMALTREYLCAFKAAGMLLWQSRSKTSWPLVGFPRAFPLSSPYEGHKLASLQVSCVNTRWLLPALVLIKMIDSSNTFNNASFQTQILLIKEWLDTLLQQQMQGASDLWESYWWEQHNASNRGLHCNWSTEYRDYFTKETVKENMVPAIKKTNLKELVCSIAAWIYCYSVRIQFILFKIILLLKATYNIGILLKNYFCFQLYLFLLSVMV